MRARQVTRQIVRIVIFTLAASGHSRKIFPGSLFTLYYAALTGMVPVLFFNDTNLFDSMSLLPLYMADKHKIKLGIGDKRSAHPGDCVTSSIPNRAVPALAIRASLARTSDHKHACIHPQSNHSCRQRGPGSSWKAMKTVAIRESLPYDSAPNLYFSLQVAAQDYRRKFLPGRWANEVSPD